MRTFLAPAATRAFCTVSLLPFHFRTFFQSRAYSGFTHLPLPYNQDSLAFSLGHTFASSSKHPINTHTNLTSSRAFSTTMSTNGEIRPKRRQSPVPQLDGPNKKRLKQENGVPTPGDATPQNGSVYDVRGDEKETLALSASLAQTGDSPEWQATIEKVIKCAVSIHFCQTCSFDTDLSTSSQATGFVVDAERGYILTNRHVVCAGPFWGYCVFDNHEEVSGKQSRVDPPANNLSVMSVLSTVTPSTILVSSNSIPKTSSTCQ